MSKIGKSFLNQELSIRTESSSPSVLTNSISPSDFESDSPISEIKESLMSGLLVNRKNTLNKIFEHLLNNSISINITHNDDKLLISAFDINDVVVNKIEIDLKGVLKYYTSPQDLSYTINSEELSNLRVITDNNIGFNITQNEIEIYFVNKNVKFDSYDDWYNKHYKCLNMFTQKILINLSYTQYNEMIKHKLNNFKIDDRCVVFKISNQHINQLYHFTTTELNEFIEFKYTRSKLYYKDYNFKNLNSTMLDMFSQKKEMEISTHLFRDLINIINNENNSETLIMISDSYLCVTLLDKVIDFKCIVYL